MFVAIPDGGGSEAPGPAPSTVGPSARCGAAAAADDPWSTAGGTVEDLASETLRDVVKYCANGLVPLCGPDGAALEWEGRMWDGTPSPGAVSSALALGNDWHSDGTAASAEFASIGPVRSADATASTSDTLLRTRGGRLAAIEVAGGVTDVGGNSGASSSHARSTSSFVGDWGTKDGFGG